MGGLCYATLQCQRSALPRIKSQLFSIPLRRHAHHSTFSVDQVVTVESHNDFHSIENSPKGPTKSAPGLKCCLNRPVQIHLPCNSALLGTVCAQVPILICRRTNMTTSGDPSGEIPVSRRCSIVCIEVFPVRGLCYSEICVLRISCRKRCHQPTLSKLYPLDPWATTKTWTRLREASW